ncbi:Melanoma-Associated Antigen C2 [Manis pentadactyla]|nr:Melanoma-Associated Antigen C2 [Manis pentadactyla]
MLDLEEDKWQLLRQCSVNNLSRDHFLRGNLRWLLSPIWFCTGPDAPPDITFG